MKHLFIIFLLILPAAVVAQQVDIKKVSIQSIAGTDYYVKADTVGTDIIIRLTPVQDQAKLLDEQIAAIEAEVAAYDERLDELARFRKDAMQRKKEIEKIQGKLAAPKATVPIVLPAPAPAKVVPVTVKKKKTRQ